MLGEAVGVWSTAQDQRTVPGPAEPQPGPGGECWPGPGAGLSAGGGEAGAETAGHAGPEGGLVDTDPSSIQSFSC